MKLTLMFSVAALAVAGAIVGFASRVPGGSGVQVEEACPGVLHGFLKYAGTYQAEQVLNETAVSKALERRLASELDHLRRNVNVTGSVDLVSCHLVISGNAPHMGGLENGIVSVSLASGQTTAAILTGGKIQIYADGDSYDAVPLSIRDWLAVITADFRYRFDLPPNARIMPGVQR